MDKYSSGLVSESFWFIEFRKIIKLKYDRKTWDEIKDLCLVDNLLGISKDYRAKRNYGYLKNRIDTLDEGLAFCHQAGHYQTRRGAQVCCHHSGALQAIHALHQRRIAVDSNIGPQAL